MLGSPSPIEIDQIDEKAFLHEADLSKGTGWNQCARTCEEAAWSVPLTRPCCYVAKINTLGVDGPAA